MHNSIKYQVSSWTIKAFVRNWKLQMKPNLLVERKNERKKKKNKKGGGKKEGKIEERKRKEKRGD